MLEQNAIKDKAVFQPKGQSFFSKKKLLLVLGLAVIVLAAAAFVAIYFFGKISCDTKQQEILQTIQGANYCSQKDDCRIVSFPVCEASFINKEKLDSILQQISSYYEKCGGLRQIVVCPLPDLSTVDCLDNKCHSIIESDYTGEILYKDYGVAITDKDKALEIYRDFSGGAIKENMVYLNEDNQYYYVFDPITGSTCCRLLLDGRLYAIKRTSAILPNDFSQKSCQELEGLASSEYNKLNVNCQSNNDCKLVDVNCGLCVNKTADTSSYQKVLEIGTAKCNFPRPTCLPIDGCTCFIGQCKIKPKCSADSVLRGCKLGPCCCPIGTKCD